MVHDILHRLEVVVSDSLITEKITTNPLASINTAERFKLPQSFEKTVSVVFSFGENQ